MLPKVTVLPTSLATVTAGTPKAAFRSNLQQLFEGRGSEEGSFLNPRRVLNWENSPDSKSKIGR